MRITGEKNNQVKFQIKSKKRVNEHGEVFTAEREVKAMCDLVAQECDRIDSRFLEPACGDGNFLAEILTRKLTTVKKLYKSNPYDFERYSVLAITSLYGVDIMQDNVTECRARLFKLWDKEYRSACKKAVSDETREAVKYILSKNILCGNALTLMCVDENQNDLDMPIIFPEWSLMLGTKLKRRDFRLDVINLNIDCEGIYTQKVKDRLNILKNCFNSYLFGDVTEYKMLTTTLSKNCKTIRTLWMRLCVSKVSVR